MEMLPCQVAGHMDELTATTETTERKDIPRQTKVFLVGIPEYLIIVFCGTSNTLLVSGFRNPFKCHSCFL